MPHTLTLWQMIKAAVAEWIEDKAARLGAALAYYTIFSIAPLLLIATAIAGLVFGPAATQGHLAHALQDTVGTQTAQTIQSLLASADKPHSGMIATVIGFLTLFIGATAVFIQLKGAMNSIWEVQPKPNPGFKYYIMNYVFSFFMVLGIGFLLIVSLLLTAVISAVGLYLGGILPIGVWFWQLINMAVSFVVVAVLFAMIFKLLPDAVIAWKDVWAGAFITSALFSIGKFGLGIYLAHSSVASTYGAAGSLLVLLLWVYYSSQILFFGAEFTQVWAASHGVDIVPKPFAMRTRPQLEINSQKQTAISA